MIKTKPFKLFNKNFLLLWQGQLVSLLGSEAFEIAIAFWIVEKTNSPTLMGLILMISSIPGILLSPIGGAFADNHSRKKIIIFSDLLRGLAVIALAILILCFPNSITLIIIALFTIKIFEAIIESFFNPAISAATPDIVPADKISAANSIEQFTSQLSAFLGKGFGGVILKMMSYPVLFLLNGITYIFSAISELFIKIPQKIPEKKSIAWKDIIGSYKKNIKEGFTYIQANKGLRNIFLMIGVLNFFILPIVILLPFFVTDNLNSGSDWYGFILAGLGVGSIIGYIIAGVIKLSGKAKSYSIILSMIITCVLLTLFGFITNSILALIIVSLLGIFNGFVQVNIISIVQSTTPSNMRGRVFGLLNTLSGAVAPLTMGLSGVIADLLERNLTPLFVVYGSIATIITIIITISSKEIKLFLAK